MEAKLHEIEDDPITNELRREINQKLNTVLNLCSIVDDVNISTHWKLFVPMCELIKATIGDEKMIPHFLSRIEGKVVEMRRRLDPANLNQVVALNILQMFAGFFKYMKTVPSASAGYNETKNEIEKLKSELMLSRTQCETLRSKLEKEERVRKDIRSMLETVENENEGSGMQLMLKNEPHEPSPSPCDVMSLLMGLAKNENGMGIQRDERGGRRGPFEMVRTSVEQDDSSFAIPPAPPTLALQAATNEHEVIPPFNELTLQSIFGDAYVPPNQTPAQTPRRTEKEEIVVEKRREKKEGRTSKRPLEEDTSLLLDVKEEIEEEGGGKVKRGRRDRGGSVPVTAKASGASGEASIYVCPFDECDRTFNRLSTMNEHTTSEHYWIGAIQLMCKTCQESFETERAFEHHMLGCPDGGIDVVAKKWEKEETKEEEEFRLETERKLLACPYQNCDYVAANRLRSRGLFNHFTKSHSSSGRPWYKCDCGRKRRTLNTIMFHHYAECREGGINWVIDGKTDDEEKEE